MTTFVMSMRNSSLSTSRHDPQDHVTIYYTGQPTYHNNVSTLPDIPGRLLFTKKTIIFRLSDSQTEAEKTFFVPKTVCKINTKGVKMQQLTTNKIIL